MTRDEALKLLHEHMQSPNLRKHCYATEAVMRALAKRLGGDPETWGIAGLVHDADYEEFKDKPQEHTKMAAKWLQEAGVSEEIINAILAHGWGYIEGNPEPKTKMEWALYCCDELTGFIVAVALVRPDPPSPLASEGQGKSKLQMVTVKAVMKKGGEKSFAAGVTRGQIEECDTRLGIPLPEFIAVALGAMQERSDDLGL